MKFFYSILFLVCFSFSSHALEYSCIDKKHGHLSKMTVRDELVKYEDQKGKPVEYKIIAVGDDITVRNENPEAIAEERAKEISVG